MAKTYAQLAKEIEALTRAAAALRKQEIPAVVARIKEAITAYGLTAADLGLDGAADRSAAASKAVQAPSKAPAKKSAGSPGKVPVKYRDSNGNSWTGRGSKPGWLQAALAAGQSLDSFAVDPAAGGGPSAAPSGGDRPAPARSAAKPKPTKSASTVKYKDDAGHTWSGFGPKPGWLKAAIADGKTLEQLAA